MAFPGFSADSLRQTRYLVEAYSDGAWSGILVYLYFQAIHYPCLHLSPSRLKLFNAVRHQSQSSIVCQGVIKNCWSLPLHSFQYIYGLILAITGPKTSFTLLDLHKNRRRKLGQTKIA